MNLQQSKTQTGHGTCPKHRSGNAAIAVDNYAKMAGIFDTAATQFTATAQFVDVEATGAPMVDQSGRLRKEWLDAQHYAHQLTKLVPALSESSA